MASKFVSRKIKSKKVYKRSPVMKKPYGIEKETIADV